MSIERRLKTKVQTYRTKSFCPCSERMDWVRKYLLTSNC